MTGGWAGCLAGRRIRHSLKLQIFSTLYSRLSFSLCPPRVPDLPELEPANKLTEFAARANVDKEQALRDAVLGTLVAAV